MNGESLHRFDLDLCRHVLDNVRFNIKKPALAEYAETWLGRTVRDYLMRLGGESEPPEVLLTDDDFEDLVEAFEGQFGWRWEPYEALYRRHVDAVLEIRESLAGPYAERWGRLSAAFEEKLTDGHTRLGCGVEVVRDWVGEARRLLRAMGRTDLLPRPEGTFPTLAVPEPPPALRADAACLPDVPAAVTPAEPASGPLSPPTVQEAGYGEMLTEILDLLRTQKTIKDFYTTEEVAKMLGKAEFTVREWCRAGRVQARKQGSGRGKYQAWVISHDELQRLQRDGLLPSVKAG